MTSWRYGASILAPSTADSTAPSPPSAGSIRPVPDLVEHPLDEFRLDGHRLAGQLGEPLDGSHDRRSGGLAIEAVETKRVREQAGNSPREAVELRERVLAQRDEHVHP